MFMPGKSSERHGRWRDSGGILVLGGAVLLMLVISLGMRRMLGAPRDRDSVGEGALALATESARGLLMAIT